MPPEAAAEPQGPGSGGSGTRFGVEAPPAAFACAAAEREDVVAGSHVPGCDQPCEAGTRASFAEAAIAGFGAR